MGREIHKFALYADDIIVYLTSPEKAVQQLMKTIEDYGEVSGYKLSENKCELLTIGKQVSQVLKDGYKIKWDTKKIRYLGINISKNLNELFEIN